MTPRTLTAPVTDRRYWRRLLALSHPDASGDHELHIWTRSVYEHLASDGPEAERTGAERTGAERPPPPGGSHTERVDFSSAYSDSGDFADLTAQAVSMADSVDEPYAQLLRMLASCYPAEDGPLYRAQHTGATYKQLAFIGHLAGMSNAQRTRWYRICESVPLSQAHAGHIIKEKGNRTDG